MRDAVLVLGRTPSFDGRYLARALADALPRLAFVASDEPIQRYRDEGYMMEGELAARHDDHRRIEWLAGRVRKAIDDTRVRVGAVLLPGILGTRHGVAEALSKLVSVPCGEILGGSSAPGARFTRGRDEAMERLGVRIVRGECTRLDSEARHHRLTVAGDVLEATHVVLATGGLVGGGLRYSPSEARPAATLPVAARPTFDVSFHVEPPLALETNRGPVLPPSSLYGEPPETFRMSLAEPGASDFMTVGIARGGLAQGLFVAGAAASSEGGAWLSALRSGVRQGSNAWM